ncbi:MAG TPA: hypothetical protein PLB12_12340 [Candidatus Goldiibacteriota bacterium]|nr:hypothetical protein [Candidatus Goldiibacteriota bacterium]HRQ45127.1 hypothetical protein [Candidatus Goldiibacteriota bacterium]
MKTTKAFYYINVFLVFIFSIFVWFKMGNENIAFYHCALLLLVAIVSNFIASRFVCEETTYINEYLIFFNFIAVLIPFVVLILLNVNWVQVRNNPLIILLNFLLYFGFYSVIFFPVVILNILFARRFIVNRDLK